MKPISGVNGRINEGLSEIRDLNEDEVQRNNQYSESSVAMVLSGPRLLMTLELKHSNLSSQKKFQLVLLSVLIPGKHTPVSLREVTFTVSLITVKNSTAMEKEIISRSGRILGIFEMKTGIKRWYPTRKITSLLRGVRMGDTITELKRIMLK